MLILANYVVGETADHIKLVGNPADLLSTIPVIVFAFFCHSNVQLVKFTISFRKIYTLYSEFSVETRDSKTRITTWISVLIVVCIYGLIGGLGYLTFGSNVSDNIITCCESSIMRYSNFWRSWTQPSSVCCTCVQYYFGLIHLSSTNASSSFSRWRNSVSFLPGSARLNNEFLYYSYFALQMLFLTFSD